MNKQQVETIIDKLADKTLSFGCEVLPQQNEADDIWLYAGCDDMLNYFFSPKHKDLFSSSLIKGDRILGHPILLGDVLSKLAPEGIELVKYEGIMPSICEYLLAYWSECGLDKSLQEIIKQSEWGKCSNCKGNGRVEMLEHCKPCSGKGEVLKSPEATELFEFLYQVIKEL